jgi:hypothetical protein
LAYAGPALSNGADYFWRAAIEDTAGIAGPFSSYAAFATAPAGIAADLRATTGGRRR